MNTLTLIGTLTKDPELRTRADNKVCVMRLAESNGHPDSPLYINIAAFGSQAETCSKSLRKGSQIAVTGQLRFREWKTDDHTRRSEYSIAAERIDFLLLPSSNSPDQAATTPERNGPTDASSKHTAHPTTAGAALPRTAAAKSAGTKTTAPPTRE
jgi:single-strand DNA-binding protein